jgi:hypothetical protein
MSALPPKADLNQTREAADSCSAAVDASDSKGERRFHTEQEARQCRLTKSEGLNFP